MKTGRRGFLIGTVALPAETMALNGSRHLTVTVFTPEPGSPEHDALRLLASWQARDIGIAETP